MALETLCETYARWVDANDKLQKTGLIVKTSKDFPIQNPLVGIINGLFKQLTTMFAEFGLTPAERSRLKFGGGQEKEPFDEFLSGPIIWEIYIKYDGNCDNNKKNNAQFDGSAVSYIFCSEFSFRGSNPCFSLLNNCNELYIPFSIKYKKTAKITSQTPPVIHQSIIRNIISIILLPPLAQEIFALISNWDKH